MPQAAYNFIPGWATKVRKDPLGAVSFNELHWLHRFSEGILQVGHVLSTDYAHHAGEHNEANVPRDVGDAYYPSGVGVEGAKYAGVTAPGTGEVDLTFSGFTFATLWDFPNITVQAQSMSENGINKPCIVGAQIVGDNDIRFYSHQLSSALGSGNTWAAEAQPFAFAIHGTPRPPGAGLVLPSFAQQGDTLPDTKWNPSVQAAADLWKNLGQGHSQSTGLHTARVVPKSYAKLHWDGSTHYVADIKDPNNPVTSVTRVGLGHVQVHFGAAWTLPMQPFFAPEYQRFAGGAPGTMYNMVAPRSLQTTTMLELYIYSYVPGGPNWVRDDVDFWVAIYAG